jgi:hypothetical protein
MLMDRVVVRRYYRDEQGRSVLIGLTFEETSEFEGLEGSVAANSSEHPFWAGEALFESQMGRRWNDLYLKHQTAWELWRVSPAFPDLPSSVLHQIDQADCMVTPRADRLRQL